ncbi:hypothetical protein FFWV33_15935 [Flavobacterium faecale]|uniref:Uncharacterized protein n=1 Tax=Flavobacterium faecale TaxID=1355330 RepID=A0A2S1LGS1_9FLAO|nr:hypothetical protein [Flavobacterium faecale]AWG22909.1 hypothetical protein FFWV33_15935 [Flavobacterium faecale]
MSEKGSKKAMSKLVKSIGFHNIINVLLKKDGLSITSNDIWIPNSVSPTKEVGLNVFLRSNFDVQVANDSIKWWLYKGSAAPKWDLISTCTINGKRGILLVEAKAHKGELKNDKKNIKKEATTDSKKNHEQIALAIAEANTHIKGDIADIALSRDSCYQFSNRVAHAWWLANQGIPVVLLYLGFLNCEDMSDNYKTFKTDKEWEDCFTGHTEIVGAEGLVGKTINCGKSTFTLICDSIKIK